MAAFFIARSKDDWDNFKEFVWDKMPFPCRIEYKSFSGTRSISQNALFHMWCQEIAQFFLKNGKECFASGDEMSKENVKKNLKRTYLGEEESISIDLETGEITRIPALRRTSKLDKGEMNHFMHKIELWALEHGIPLTHPADCEYEKLREAQNG